MPHQRQSTPNRRALALLAATAAGLRWVQQGSLNFSFSSLAGNSISSSGLRRTSELPRSSRIALAASEDDEVEALLVEALELESDRSELLLSQIDIMNPDTVSKPVPQEAIDEVRQLLDMAKAGGSGKLFKPLQTSNNKLQESISIANQKEPVVEEQPVISSLPSYLPKWYKQRPAGLDINVDVLPPVPRSEDPAVIGQAANLRVTMPIFDLGGLDELLWGADVTPFFDDDGDQLIVIILPFSLGPYPAGVRLANADRPLVAPEGKGNTVVVESVIEGSEADKAGIKAGDYLRAFSYMKDPQEPSFLDQTIDNFLGSTGPDAPLKAVIKCDTWAVEDVEKKLLTNRNSPDGEITLLLERPI
eukprot:CAMPEP_0178410256 /NCGR_PEP_ID=MMETSP0689_2-20121128/20884_1 /TAXON_ID=160604 /ORGANISM="Amphidinium massartii, Strain CS-259" /LENGTH=360 /DNA_ID=CAMNT_0020031423 /DNA_START=48 /DNA_END=1130 /DNA_ORIENTATION=+